MKKKIAIIGGGITACACALYLVEKNYEVEVFEKKTAIGGILRDVKVENNLFLSGPQYLEESKWLKVFLKNKILRGLFKEDNLNYGSFTELFDKSPVISNNFAHPTTLKKYKKINISKKNGLTDRIECYQSNISKPLNKWIKNFNKDTDKLHTDCSKAMQIGRVFFKNSEKETLKEKKENKIKDKLLGVPFQKKYSSFFTPKKGYDSIFNQIYKILKKKGVKFNFNQTIKIKKINDLKIFNNKIELKADFYIWACNPVPLIKTTQNKILDNPAVKISTFFFEVDLKKKFTSDIYFQIFSNKTKINRIFIYKFSKKLCVNIECFFDNKTRVEIIKDQAKKILKKFGYSFLKFDLIGEKKDLRHILFTKNDLKNFTKFYQDSKYINIIPGFWEEYGREQKILKLFKEIEKRIDLQ